MPILNTRGDALAGIDGSVSVNGVPVSALLGVYAGAWRFLTDDIIAGQALIGGAWSLWQVDRHTSADELRMLDGAGANEFRAGGAQWLAYTVPPPLVRGTIARATGQGRALYDLGRDGVAVVKDNQAAERGLTVVTPTGVQPYPDYIFVAYQDGHLLAVTQAGLTLIRVADWLMTPIPDLGVRGGRICAAPDGVVYQVFYWRGYTVVQRLGTYDGWVVRFSEFDFNPDIVAHGFDPSVIVATSAGQGERPEQTQKYTIDLRITPTDLRDLMPPVILPPVENVAALGRPAFIGPYQFNTWATL